MNATAMADARPKSMRVQEALDLAEQHAAAGRTTEAEGLLIELLRARPLHAEAWHRRGLLALKDSRKTEAFAYLNQAATLEPDNAVYQSNLSTAYRRLGKHKQAVAAAERAVSLAPNWSAAHNNLGRALYEDDRPEVSLAAFEKALAFDPNNASAYNNQGNALRRQGDLVGAIASYRRSLTLDASLVDTHSNLAVCLQDRAEYAEARRHFEAALALDPNHANAVTNLSLLDLLEGRFEIGWQRYERRWQSNQMRERKFKMPRWTGEALAGKHLYVYGEQGLGDTLHLCRYLPRLLAAGARITCEVQPKTLGLLGASFPGVAFQPTGARVLLTDYEVPLASLPGLFRTDLSNIDGKVPYLTVPAPRLARWRAVVEAAAPPEILRVGLVWYGSTVHKRDFWRSMTLKQLRPLADLPGTAFFSLQIGERPSELGDWPEGRILDLAPRIGDFTDTAAAIKALDLLISVDTSVVHAAGAVAQPTWVLLPKSPDWRWLLDRADSPWYPTLRLFRQAEVDQWDTVVDAVAAALPRARAALIARRQAQLN